MRRHSGQQSGAAAGAGRRCAVRLGEHKALPRKSHKVRVVGGNTVRLHIPPTVMRVNVDEIHFSPFRRKGTAEQNFSSYVSTVLFSGDPYSDIISSAFYHFTACK